MAKKSSSLPIILIILGVVGVGCLGVCGVGGYFLVKKMMEINSAAPELMATIGRGEFEKAYNSTSPDFQARYTLEQFTSAMKGAKLVDHKSVVFGEPQTQGNLMRFTAETSLKDGGTTTVTVTIKANDDFSFVIEDITGPDIDYGTDEKPAEPEKPKDDDKKTDPEDK